MKIRFGKDATGPFVEVTREVRDQDDLVGAEFFALSHEDRMKVCEHLPRAVNDRPAVRDHSEAQIAAPPPGTVAALLAVVDRITFDAPDDQPNGAAEAALLEIEKMLEPHKWPKSAAHTLADLSGIMARPCSALADDCRDLRVAAEGVRATLGAPTPLDLAVGEVCAMLPGLGASKTGASEASSGRDSTS